MPERFAKLKGPPPPPIEEIFTTKGRVKILVIFAMYGELSATESRHLTQLNSSSVRIHLDYLLNFHIIKERKTDKTKKQRLRAIRDPRRIRAIRDPICLINTPLT